MFIYMHRLLLPFENRWFLFLQRYFNVGNSQHRKDKRWKQKNGPERNVCLIKFQIKHSVFNTLNNDDEK